MRSRLRLLLRLSAVVATMAAATHLPIARGLLAAQRSTPDPALAALPLVQQDGLSYSGAFRVPLGASGETSFAWGGTAIAFNPDHGSLFIVGHDWRQQIAEISIPEVRKGTAVADLATGTVLQPLADITEGRLKGLNPGDPNGNKIGGILPYNGKLYVSAFAYYDAAGTQVRSHYVSGLDLNAAGDVDGPYRVGNLKAGYVSGYMALVPSAWRAALGGPAVTGNCCIPIVSRTSYGPALFSFDPAQASGDRKEVPATPLVYYPSDRPLQPWDSTGPNFNGSTEIRGVVIPENTRSALFFGRHGTGPFCYGAGTRDQSLNLKLTPDGVTKYCYDPGDGGKGVHTYPYSYRVWAYDLNDLAAAKSGRKRPWDVKPYAAWTLTLPFTGNQVRLLGATYDPATQRIFVSQWFGDGLKPVIHVLTVAGAATSTSN